MNKRTPNRPVQLLVAGTYIIAVLILVSLGIWQFARGQHKADLEKRIDAVAESRLELATAPEAWDDLNYRQVAVTGTPVPSGTMLLDNRIYQGQVGYEVIVPFAFKDDSATVLINRGWISREQAGLLRNDATVDDMNISGQLYSPDTGIMLVDTVVAKNQWPRVIAYLDIPGLADELGVPLAPAVVVLDADADYGFQRIWEPYVMTPMQHYGYAVQWWGLTLVLLVFGWVWKFRRKR